jgi:hypothetical protein
MDTSRLVAASRASLAEESGIWGELFSPRLRVPLFIGIALAILQQVTGINVFMNFPKSQTISIIPLAEVEL